MNVAIQEDLLRLAEQLSIFQADTSRQPLCCFPSMSEEQICILLSGVGGSATLAVQNTYRGLDASC